MPAVEARLRILKMVEERKITAEDGARLLDALEDSRQPGTTPGAHLLGADTRWFRVRVTDTATGKSKVNVNLPIGLLNVGIKMGARFSPNVEGMKLDQVLESIRSGASGKIVDLMDQAHAEHVEIFLE